jgi:hypothetical protein
MKNTVTFLKLGLCTLVLLFATGITRAQFVTTVPPLAGTNNQSGITFNVGAANALNITEIWCSFLTGTYTVSVWYNTDSINGAPTINATNGWVQACNNVPLVVAGGGVGIIQQIPFAFSIPMAPGDVFGFYIEATNLPNAACLYYTNYVPPAQYVWGNADMYINTGNGNVGWGGPSPNPTFTPRMFNGKVVYQLTGPPNCDQGPANITKTNVDLHSATVSWDPAPNAITYEYLVDQVQTDPTSSGYNYTTTPSFTVNNLPDGTCYYVHIRSVCAQQPEVTSAWVLDSFCTVADCYAPVPTISNITSNTAVATWDPVKGAIGYEYSVGTTPDTPTNGHNTTYTSVKLQGLWPNKPLYFFLKAKCSPTPQSPWTVTPFHTMAHTGVSSVSPDGFELLVYPNPVKDILTITLGDKPSSAAKVTITDVMGRVLLVKEMTADRLDINTADLSAGMYFIRYSDDKHENLVKVLKQ